MASRPVGPDSQSDSIADAPTHVKVDGKQKTRFQSFLDDTYEHAEVAGLFLFLIALLVWSVFLPKKRWYPPNPETELNLRLQGALSAAGGQMNAKATGLDFARPERALLVQADYAPPSPSSKYWAGVVEELRCDLVVWNRYEDEFRTFRWGTELNWYLFSTLRVIVIILSAITPALIVAPVLKDKKFLAALPAAIVAIGTGCISEFDFKTEAARYDTALVAVQGEKTSFITQSSPYYQIPSVSNQKRNTDLKGKSGKSNGQASQQPNSTPDRTLPAATTIAQATDACSKSTTDGVPFPKPNNYPETRANFACRIQQILQAQTEERDQFLRGEPRKPSSAPSTAPPSQTKTTP